MMMMPKKDLSPKGMHQVFNAQQAQGGGRSPTKGGPRRASRATHAGGVQVSCTGGYEVTAFAEKNETSAGQTHSFSIDGRIPQHVADRTPDERHARHFTFRCALLFLSLLCARSRVGTTRFQLRYWRQKNPPRGHLLVSELWRCWRSSGWCKPHSYVRNRRVA